MARHRERDLRIQECGTLYKYSIPSQTTGCMTHGLLEVCDDVVGNPTSVNDFRLSKTFTHYPKLNGVFYSGGGTPIVEFVSYPIGDKPIPADPSTFWGSVSIAERNQKAWEILAQTNPSVPHVSVPSFVGELKDLPELFKSWGDTLLKKVASAHLSWRWALRPMIGDLWKMINFVKACDQRFLMLYRLRDGKTLRRRCHFGVARSTSSVQTNHLFHADGVSFTGTFYTHYVKETWGTAQWKLQPNSELPRLGYQPLVYLARRLTAGITTHEMLAAAWELTPWSWLVDWFSNVGTIVQATNNSLGLTWSHIAYMRKTQSWVHAKPNVTPSNSWCHLDSDYVLFRECKERFNVSPVIPVPLPYLPVITSGKLSILASLAVLRR